MKKLIDVILKPQLLVVFTMMLIIMSLGIVDIIVGTDDSESGGGCGGGGNVSSDSDGQRIQGKFSEVSKAESLEELEDKYQFSVDIPITEENIKNLGAKDDLRVRLRPDHFHKVFANKNLDADYDMNTPSIDGTEAPDWDSLKAGVIDSNGNLISLANTKLARDSKNYIASTSKKTRYATPSSYNGGLDIAQAIYGKIPNSELELCDVSNNKSFNGYCTLTSQPDSSLFEINGVSEYSATLYLPPAVEIASSSYIAAYFDYPIGTFLEENKTAGTGLEFTSNLDELYVKGVAGVCAQHATYAVTASNKIGSSYRDTHVTIDISSFTMPKGDFIEAGKEEKNVPFLLEFNGWSALETTKKDRRGSFTLHSNTIYPLGPNTAGSFVDIGIITKNYSKYQSVILFKDPANYKGPYDTVSYDDILGFRLDVNGTIKGGIKDLAFLRYEPWLIIPKELLKEGNVVRLFFNPSKGKSEFSGYPIVDLVGTQPLANLTYQNAQRRSKHSHVVQHSNIGDKSMTFISANPRHIIERTEIIPANQDAELKLPIVRGERFYTMLYARSSIAGKIVSVKSVGDFINDLGDKINPLVDTSLIVQKEDAKWNVAGNVSIDKNKNNEAEHLKLKPNENIGIGLTFEIPKNTLQSVEGGVYRGSIEVVANRYGKDEIFKIPTSMWVHTAVLPNKSNLKMMSLTNMNYLTILQTNENNVPGKKITKCDANNTEIAEIVAGELRQKHLDRRFAGFGFVPGYGLNPNGLTKDGEDVLLAGLKLKDEFSKNIVGYLDVWSNPLSEKRFYAMEVWHDAAMVFDTGFITQTSGDEKPMMSCTTGNLGGSEFLAQYGPYKYDPLNNNLPSVDWSECVENYHGIIADTFKEHYAGNIYFYLDEQRQAYAHCQGIKMYQLNDRVWEAYKITRDLGYRHRIDINEPADYAFRSNREMVPHGITTRYYEQYRLQDADLRVCSETPSECPIDDAKHFESFINAWSYTSDMGIGAFIEGATGANWGTVDHFRVLKEKINPNCEGGKELCMTGSNQFGSTVEFEWANLATVDYDLLFMAKQINGGFNHWQYLDSLMMNNGDEIALQTTEINKIINVDLTPGKSIVGPFFVVDGDFVVNNLSATNEVNMEISKDIYPSETMDSQGAESGSGYYFIKLSSTASPESNKIVKAKIAVQYLTDSPFSWSLRYAYRAKDMSAYMNVLNNHHIDMDLMQSIRNNAAFSLDAYNNCVKYDLDCGYPGNISLYSTASNASSATNDEIGTSDQTAGPKSVTSETSCSLTYYSNCLDEQSCKNAGAIWCNNPSENSRSWCGSPQDGCPSFACDAENPWNCISEDSCTSVGGNWCNNYCQSTSCAECSIDQLWNCYDSAWCNVAGGNWCTTDRGGNGQCVDICPSTACTLDNSKNCKTEGECLALNDINPFPNYPFFWVAELNLCNYMTVY